MPVPKVAIVGRPNVGKSSLFNWLAGKRIAIVDPTAGVTRDRVTYLLSHNDRFAELVDTGGMGNIDKDGLTDDIERQIQIALDEASLVLFLVDAQTGFTEHDRMVSRKLREFTKPILYIVNKCDTAELERQGAEFYKLGRDLIFVSVKNNRGRDDLLHAVFDNIPVETEPDHGEVTMKFCVVGKRNSGKSTFINTLAQAERMIVSEVAGTTRDSVDVHFEHNGRTLIAIDTAGVRRAKSLSESVDFYGYTRAQRSIRRADVVFHMMDASLPLSKVDKQLNGYIIDQAKPCIFVINKWDLIKDQTTTEDFNDYLNAEFPDLTFAPRVFITAKEGKNVHGLIDVAHSLFNQSKERVTTGELNRLVETAIAKQNPPMRRNRRLKIFYTTQVAVQPPTIIFFCNDPKLVELSWHRYLLNFLRDYVPFDEIPIKTYFRSRDHVKKAEKEGADDVEIESERD
ncbi:ribosome biogenesis GTPase Der [bacterium]|nr:ribosome biogenesis GTPase Der [bacterium]